MRCSPWRALLIWSALGAAVSCGPSTLVPSAHAKTSQRCAQAHGKTVVVNATTRVYRRSGGGGTYACALPGGRSLGLGDQEDFPDLAAVGSVTVAGKYVAYVLTISDRTGSVVHVSVVDARARRAVHGLPVDDQQNGAVGGVVVTPAGAAAWTVTRTDGVKRVWTVGPKVGSGPTPVAAGSGIDVASLALGAGRIFWMQDGVPQTAAL